MKSFLIPVILLTSLAPLVSGAEGAVDGGGAKAVVCRGLFGSIRSVELLDLYEARVQHGRTIVESSDSVEAQIDQFVSRLATAEVFEFHKVVRMVAGTILQKMRVLPDGTALKETDDSFEVIVPRGCKIEQLANFTAEGQVLVDGKFWKKLSRTQRAALIAHEALYSLLRDRDEDRDSRRTRFVIGLLFAGENLEPVFGEVPSDAFECYAREGDRTWNFKFFRNAENGMPIFQFFQIDGKAMLSRVRVPFWFKLPQQNEIGFDCPVTSKVERFGIRMHVDRAQDTINELSGWVYSSFEPGLKSRFTCF